MKKPYATWDNPNSFEEKKLYLNLRYKPEDNDAEDGYMFEFKSQKPNDDEENYWFKVGDILKIDQVLRYCRENSLGDDEADILEKLKNVFCTQRIISYYEETEKNLDKVLRIFIRVNSGGTPLSYSDLLMSIITANFSSDIREVMNELVDKLRAEGFGCFGRDQVLKTCLLLTGINHKFMLKNFSKSNIKKIEEQWESITGNIYDAINIVKGLGYAGQLSSGYIISTIALYLSRKNKKSNDIDGDVNERNAIWQFVRTSQILSYFSTSLDTKLTNVLDRMKDAEDFRGFNKSISNSGGNKSLKLTSEDVDWLLELKYGAPATLPVLQMLYPNLDYRNSTFHIDHIYPKSKFNNQNKSLDEKYYKDRDCLFNLQLLEGQANVRKRDITPCEWIDECFRGDQVKIDEYKKRNYIEMSSSLEWQNFGEFKEKRLQLLRKSLTQYLNSME